MKTKYKMAIAFSLIIIAIFTAIQIRSLTGKATATIEFSIVENVTTPTPSPGPSGGGTGGAGGGGGPGIPCNEDWLCSGWEECSQAEYQTRTCVDNKNCKTIKNKPSEVQRCNYITRPETCFNNVKDINEEGVDCGGKCVACPSCSDGIKNGDETDVDCGGKCNACIVYAEEKKPVALRIKDIINNASIFWPIWLVLTILFLLLIYLYNHMRETYVEHKLPRHAYR